MNELWEALDRRARRVAPSPQALHRIVRSAARRRRSRRFAGGAVAFLLFGAGLGGAGVVAARLPGPRQRVVDAEAVDVVGSGPARALRTALGIVGRSRAGSAAMPIPQHDRSGVQVAPASDAEASNPTEPARTEVPDAKAGAKDRWSGPDGMALFASVDGRWVRVAHPFPDGPAGPEVRALRAPRIPGGPILLSVSPDGHDVLLFGVTHPPGAAAVPHLYLGMMVGSHVTHPQRVEVPAGAIKGPMGWVGANAFLLAPAPGQALLVRTDGSRLPVRVEALPDPCRGVGAPCIEDGPGLLGTNLDGSLLLWRVAALRPNPGPGARRMLIRYYATWLNGTHAVRLTGPSVRYGPPVAAP